ncbi:hypothetical protein BHM03_00058732, partial [Ensete ventricosum]
DTDTRIARYRSVPLKPKSPRAGTTRDEVTPPSPCETRRRLVSPFAFAGAEQGTCCSARRSNPKGIMVSETSSRKNAKRKVAPIGQISRRDRSWFSRGTIMCSEPYMLRKSTSKQYLHKAQWTERATRSCCMILNEVMH